MNEAQSDKSARDGGARKFEFHHKDAGKPSIIHVILLNRTLRILLSLGIFCVLVPLVDYFYFYSSEIAEYEIDDSGICSHYPIYQIPCGSENATEVECIANACCFSPNTGCYHFLPSKYQLNTVSSFDAQRPQKELDLVSLREKSPLGTKTFSTMKFNIQPLTDEILSIALWSPQHHNHRQQQNQTSDIMLNYEIKVFSPEFFVEVKRKNRTIFSTSRGALITSENYFEWSFHLGSGVQLIAGFDELFQMQEGRRILINNEHSSVIPYVVGFDSTSKSYHAVHFESIDSPAEMQILKSNTIVIRQYASTSFNLKLFTGPSFDDVFKQLKSMTSHYFPIHTPWAFGIHVCQYGHDLYETKVELDHLLMNMLTLPFDSHCIDAELTALAREGVLDEYSSFIVKLRESRRKFLLHLTLSAVEVDEEPSDEIFLKNDDGNYVEIYERMRKVLYFDYITKADEVSEFLKRSNTHRIMNVSDGIFLYRAYPFHIDDTPSNHEYLENFNFKPKNVENEIEQLIPLNVKLVNGELLIHQLNNYGREQIQVFQQTLNNFSRNNSDDNGDGKKFCIADSYREGSECGMLMREAKTPTWSGFQASIHKSVFYSITGMSFFGSEVCGSPNYSISEDLCIRWYQFAIFTPLFYVHASKIPTKFTKYAERLMLHAIRTRYSLLGYMQTCMSMKNLPLLRPLNFAYPDSINETSHQFMFGDSLMIAPISEPLVVELDLAFPEKYFELWSGMEMMMPMSRISIVMHDIPIFIRAGHIVALNLAHESLSYEEARLQPHLLIIALKCTNSTCHARGSHKIDVLEIKFEASENHLNITTSVITAAKETNPNGRSGRDAICGPKPFASSEFRLAKIYGLQESESKYSNDYLSLDLNICDDYESEEKDWKGRFQSIKLKD